MSIRCCFLLCDNSSNENIQLCPDCKLISFCSRLCQSIHKGGRSNIISSIKTHCLPFEVQFKENIGRCLVATRDIKVNELVLSDSAVVASPQSLPICPVCLENLPLDKSVPCPDCRLPTCSIACSERHANCPECGPYKRLETLEWERGLPNVLFSSIGVIRYLANYAQIQKELPQHWMDKLMDHLDDMQKDKVISGYLQGLTEFISKDCALDGYAMKEIQRAYGVLRVNSIGMEGMHSGRVLFPIVSMISHSCVSNLFFEELSDDQVLLLAQRDIPKGEDLTIRYISFLTGTNGRQTLLMDQWYFNCSCIRCSDPTELGTFSNGLRCEPPCKEGLVQMMSPDEWSCRDCSKVYAPLEIQVKLGEAVRMLSSSNDQMRSIESCEKTLDAVKKNQLSSQHFLVIKMVIHIISLYLSAFKISEMSDEQLVKFINHHETILSYLDTVDPGRSILIGTFLKHYVQAKTVYLTNRMRKKSIERGDALKEMKNLAYLDKQVKKMTTKYVESC